MDMHRNNNRILYINPWSEERHLGQIDKNNQLGKQPYMVHLNNAYRQLKLIFLQAFHPE